MYLQIVHWLALFLCIGQGQDGTPHQDLCERFN
jgi:hypothetical protein